MMPYLIISHVFLENYIEDVMYVVIPDLEFSLRFSEHYGIIMPILGIFI